MLTSLIPVGDDNSDRIETPYLTYLLIALNVCVFLFLQLPHPAFTYGYSVIPYEITTGRDIVHDIMLRNGTVIPEAPGPSPIYFTILTAMFMHGGLMHLAGNMLYLWIFGDNVEDALGHFKFLMFYLLCGVAAAFAQIFTDPTSIIPSLGASGAIAGVLGAYLVLYPTRRVRVFVWYLGLVDVPAVFVIGLWVALQFFSGIGQIAVTDQTASGGVAYWAHVGGALTGIVLIALLRDDDTHRRRTARMARPTNRSYFNDPD